MTLPAMPEAILRRIWQEQNFTRGHLATSDRRPVTILSPGTPNTDAGPDFLNAKIVIGGTTFSGDVEIHVNAEEWRSHNHDIDPHYNKVILHVVLSADPLAPPVRTQSKRPIPLLVLHPFLDERFHDAWKQALLTEEHSSPASLRCKELNHNVPPNIIIPWLEKLAQERIELKLRRYEERLKQLVDERRHVMREPYPRYYGNPDEIPAPKHEYSKRDVADRNLWEQILYEGIMECLGYARNSRPFLRLAQHLPLRLLRGHSLEDTQTMMALLFGSAGLLPAAHSMELSESREYVKVLKRTWNAARKKDKHISMNPGDWMFFRLRPDNFPTARLAAMCFLLPRLFGEGAFRRLVRIFKDESLPSKERKKRLIALFAVEPDAYWSSHYHFKGKRKSDRSSTQQQSGSHHGISLGSARISDILINAVIPIFLLYARTFKDPSIGRNCRSLLSSIPSLQENSITAIIEQQLVREKAALNTALLQQGAIQLFRYYCLPARCGECAIGRLAMPIGDDLPSDGRRLFF